MGTALSVIGIVACGRKAVRQNIHFFLKSRIANFVDFHSIIIFQISVETIEYNVRQKTNSLDIAHKLWLSQIMVKITFQHNADHSAS